MCNSTILKNNTSSGSQSHASMTLFRIERLCEIPKMRVENFGNWNLFLVSDIQMELEREVNSLHGQYEVVYCVAGFDLRPQLASNCTCDVRRYCNGMQLGT